MTDVIAEMGTLFLGSRLKRLADQFQVSATKILQSKGFDIQPAHQPLLVALEKGAMTVGQLAQAVGSSQPGITRAVRQLTDLKLVATERGNDQRERHLSLTNAGREVLSETRRRVWPAVQTSVDALCDGLSGSLIDQIAELETRLKAQPFDARVAAAASPALTIVEYDDHLAPVFAALNTEWIEAMFVMEPADRAVLDDPRGRIIDRGGAVLFIEAEGLGIVGTGALQPAPDGGFELIKMAVSPKAQGLGAGRRLLQALIQKAQDMGVRDLWLLSNARCAPAIRLYETSGFVHDARVMAQHGSEYDRCDVAMSYAGWTKQP